MIPCLNLHIREGGGGEDGARMVYGCGKCGMNVERDHRFDRYVFGADDMCLV